MYPHPCGFFNDPSHGCPGTPPLMQRYVSDNQGYYSEDVPPTLCCPFRAGRTAFDAVLKATVIWKVLIHPTQLHLAFSKR